MDSFLVQFIINIIIFTFCVYLGTKIYDFSRHNRVAPILTKVRKTFIKQSNK